MWCSVVTWKWGLSQWGGWKQHCGSSRELCDVGVVRNNTVSGSVMAKDDAGNNMWGRCGGGIGVGQWRVLRG